MENIRSFENKPEQKNLTFETTDSRGWTGKAVFTIDPRWKHIKVTYIPVEHGAQFEYANTDDHYRAINKNFKIPKRGQIGGRDDREFLLDREPDVEATYLKLAEEQARLSKEKEGLQFNMPPKGVHAIWKKTIETEIHDDADEIGVPYGLESDWEVNSYYYEYVLTAPTKDPGGEINAPIINFLDPVIKKFGPFSEQAVKAPSFKIPTATDEMLAEAEKRIQHLNTLRNNLRLFQINDRLKEIFNEMKIYEDIHNIDITIDLYPPKREQPVQPAEKPRQYRTEAPREPFVYSGPESGVSENEERRESVVINYEELDEKIESLKNDQRFLDTLLVQINKLSSPESVSLQKTYSNLTKELEQGIKTVTERRAKPTTPNFLSQLSTRSDAFKKTALAYCKQPESLPNKFHEALKLIPELCALLEVDGTDLLPTLNERILNLAVVAARSNAPIDREAISDAIIESMR